MEFFVAATNSVSMSKKESFAVNICFQWFAVNVHARFFWEIVEHPEIVIAGKEMHLDTFVGQFGNFPQNASETAWNNPAVFEPEVEDITEKVNFFG